MIHLRPLQQKDAPHMLEWMHDERVNRYFQFDFASMTEEDALRFIGEAQDFSQSVHLAIAGDDDVYLGTVSLKHIDPIARCAEFAIVLRSCAQGRGAGMAAVRAILDRAFGQLALHCVYLNVLSDNKPAVSLYEKAGFIYEGTFRDALVLHGERKSIRWYRMLRDEYELAKAGGFGRADIDGVRMIQFAENGDDRGRLVVAECGGQVPFEIRRIFYIYGSDSDVVRGCHANRRSQFLLINVSGSSKVRVTDGRKERIYALDRPHVGLYLPRMIWKEMYAFSPDSVLLVLSNERYDPSEYVRDYDAYQREVAHIE